MHVYFVVLKYTKIKKLKHQNYMPKYQLWSVTGLDKLKTVQNQKLNTT